MNLVWKIDVRIGAGSKAVERTYYVDSQKSVDMIKDTIMQAKHKYTIVSCAMGYTKPYNVILAEIEQMSVILARA